MSLRPRIASLLLPALLGILACGAYAAGCGDAGSVVCEPTGGPCQQCDALGCRPANGGGGSDSGSSSSSGHPDAGHNDAGDGGEHTDAGGHDGGHDGSTDASSDGSDDASDGSMPCDPTKEACPCPATGSCPTGEDCVEGLCVVGCDFTYECGAGRVCANGACVPACSTTMPCAAGYTCANEVACEPDPFNPMCSTAHPCPSGQECVSGLCTTACDASSQCPTGDICDGATHACIPDPSPVPVCDTAKPCPVPQACLADGFCHYPCYTEADCTMIDNRFVACSDGYCRTQEEVNPECTLSMPCPSGESCVSNVCY